MANSPPICQYLMLHIFSSLMEHSNILFYIYMMSLFWETSHHQAFVTSQLKENNFKVAPDKIQSIPPFKIVGSILIWFPQLHIKNSYILPQLQKVLKEINWMRP